MSNAVTRAANDIDEAADLPGTGTIDALNLLVDATLYRLFTDPDASLADVVDANYAVGEKTRPAWSRCSRGSEADALATVKQFFGRTARAL